MTDRSEALNRVLVTFAANLSSDDYSVQDILDHLVGSILHLLPIDGAGVMVVDNGEDLHFLAATDSVVRTIETFQHDADEGPCREAYLTGHPCSLDDLSVDTKFPEFSALAAREGMAAVFSFPVGTGPHRLGALDLYRRTPGPLSPEDSRMAGILADVAAAYLLNARNRLQSSAALADLNHRSLHDPLTGLPNRSLLAELLTEALARAERTRRRTAVLFLDLDGFKAVNDRLGHHVGDLVLVAVAARLAGSLRPGDTLARLGGDEFVAVCEDLPTGSRAADVIHRLLSAMALPFHIDDHDVVLGASIGVALADRRGENSAHRLLSQADAAMYTAKRAGGNRHHLYVENDDRPPRTPSAQDGAATAETTPRAAQQVSWRVPIPAGHERFATAYQPIIDVHDGRVLAVETLLRWRMHAPGADLPAAVVSEAERSGAILGLGEWVLRRACRDAVRQDRTTSPAHRTTVNVSAQQITGPAFVRTVENILAETGADPRRLCLELTESSVLPDDRRTVNVLTHLKELGLQLWLDDFGSGYSSLNYLRVFPLDAVKIDPSFAGRLPTDQASRAIIASTTGMCHELGLQVIVERVETEAELAAAVELGADALQGFLLGRPMSAENLAKFTPSHHPALNVPVSGPGDPPGNLDLRGTSAGGQRTAAELATVVTRHPTLQ